MLDLLKQKLNITWNDEKTDNKLNSIIDDAKIVMNHKLGAEIDYSAPDEAIGRILFLNYCMYAWNDCLEEFDSAYKAEILIARSYYGVKKSHEKKDTTIE